MKSIAEKLPLVIFLLSIIGVVWVVGALSARFQIFPYPYFDQAIRQAKTIIRPHRYNPAVYDFEGARMHDLAKSQPGVTLVTSYSEETDWHPGAKLLAADGTVLHRWVMVLDEIYPNRTIHDSYLHGTYLFPNGDLLFNIEFLGVGRMDSCGKILWTAPGTRGHHSVHRAADGNFWISGNRMVGLKGADKEFFQEYPGLAAPVYEDLLVKITPEGEVLQSISLVDVIYKNGLQRLMPQKLPGHGDGYSGDIFHLNDVEELTPEMAGQYPLFEAGDLVVSLRQIDLVFVVDPETGKVKWADSQSWIMQHDPDFIGDGWIGVFDNNRDLTERGTMMGGSRIIAIRPHTGEQKMLYPVEGATPFYTEFGGKWQTLANGNMLITEARAARVFEATPAGETVWEWVNSRFRGELVPEVMEGTRYPFTAEEVAEWPCSG